MYRKQIEQLERNEQKSSPKTCKKVFSSMNFFWFRDEDEHFALSRKNDDATECSSDMIPDDTFFRSVHRRQHWAERVKAYSLNGGAVDEMWYLAWTIRSQSTYLCSFKVVTKTPLTFQM